MTFHDFFRDLLKNSITWVKQLFSESNVKTIIDSTEINFQLIFGSYCLSLIESVLIVHDFK